MGYRKHINNNDIPAMCMYMLPGVHLFRFSEPKVYSMPHNPLVFTRSNKFLQISRIENGPRDELIQGVFGVVQLCSSCV